MGNQTKFILRSKYTKSEKILSLTQIFIAVIIVVSAVLGLLNIFNKSMYVFIPLSGIFSILSYFQYRKKNKKISYFQLGVGVFIFLCFIVMIIKQILL